MVVTSGRGPLNVFSALSRRLRAPRADVRAFAARRLAHVLAVAFVAFSGITCSDSLTGPSRHGGAAIVRVVPSFSIADAAAFDALGQAGLRIDNIHIHIDHPPAPAFDSVFTVPAGADSVVLSFPVLLNGPTEQLTLRIDLRDGVQVLFSGTQTLTAVVGGAPNGPPPGVPIVYVGPGAAATRLVIAPHDTTIRMDGRVQYRFAALDANGAAVSDATVLWHVADPAMGSIDSLTGLFTPSGAEGATRIRAEALNGLRDSATVRVTAPPSKLVVVSGGDQTGVAGGALPQPLVVQAQTPSGTPVPGVAIAFAGPATGGVSPASAVTDSTGSARTTMTLGDTAGTQTFSASSAGLTGVTVAETATAGAAASLVRVSGNAQTDSVGSILAQPFVVRAADAFGNPVANATVDWAVVAGAGSLSASSSQTAGDGTASVKYTLSTAIRTDTVSAALHGAPASVVLFTASSRAKNPSAIVRVAGNGQKGVVGTTLPDSLVVRVVDDSARPVSGVLVRWAMIGGGGVLHPDSSVTDTAGLAASALTLGPAAGLNTVSASAGATLSATFTDTATAGTAAAMTKAAGDSQTVAAGTAVPVKPAVRITDAHGNAIRNASVTFAVSAGGGSATGTSAATDSTGTATVGGWTVGSTGAQTLTATSGALTATFTAFLSGTTTATIASTKLNLHVDTLTSLGDAVTLSAQAYDASNAPLRGTFTWVSRTPATATVSSAGLVTAAANGSTWVVVTEAGGTKDSAQIVVQQRVATVMVTPATRSIYLTRNYTLTAAAVDGRGHPMGGTTKFTWASNATAVATVDTTGLVTGVGLGPAQITATAGGVTGVAQITVLTPITRIVVGRDSAGLLITDTTSLKALGYTRTFIAVAHDTLDAPMTGVTFTWASTNPSVAALDSITGTTTRATAAANGVTSITATAQGVTGSAGLKVAQVLASIQLTPDTLAVAVSGAGALTARGLDANGRFISGGTFKYASGQPAVATVDSATGVVTGVANGTAFVTATSGTIVSDTAVVQVGGTVPARISFGRDTLSVGRGSSVSVPVYLSRPSTLPVTVTLGVGDTVAYWSSATLTIPAGATSANATLNGHNAGTTTVTAVDAGTTGFAGDTAVLAVQATMRLTSGSYAINATDQVSTQVLLSDPSPAGGTYVTFSFGTAGVAAVSPSPAFIPAGQLAADIQISGVAAGTTTITPVATGVNGTSSNFTAYAPTLRFSSTAERLGVGQNEPYVYVYLPTYNNLPVPVTLTSTDSNAVSVTSSVTIPGAAATRTSRRRRWPSAAQRSRPRRRDGPRPTASP